MAGPDGHMDPEGVYTAVVRIPTVVGLAVGAVLAAPVAWLFRSGLLQVQPFDPLVFGGVLVVLLSAGCVGCLLPAIRATRVDPQVALAAE